MPAEVADGEEHAAGPHAATTRTSAQLNGVPRKADCMPSAKWRTGKMRAIHKIHDGVSLPNAMITVSATSTTEMATACAIRAPM